MIPCTECAAHYRCDPLRMQKCIAHNYKDFEPYSPKTCPFCGGDTLVVWARNKHGYYRRKRECV